MSKRGEFTDVEAFLRLHFLRRIKKDLEHPRADAIHVSSLVYDCPRRVYFDWKFTNYKGIFSPYDERSLANFWIGSKIHELPMSNVMITEDGVEVLSEDEDFQIVDAFKKVGRWQLHYFAIIQDGKEVGIFGHEVPVWDEEYNIVGTLDELVMTPDKKLILIDKKTTSSIPARPYEHHVKQVKMYAYMLENNYGVFADKGAVFYIKKVGDKDWELLFRPYEFELNDVQRVVKEMLRVANEVLDADVKGKIPKAFPSWLCSKCPYYEVCIELGFEEKSFDLTSRDRAKDRQTILGWIR